MHNICVITKPDPYSLRPPEDEAPCKKMEALASHSRPSATTTTTTTATTATTTKTTTTTTTTTTITTTITTTTTINNHNRDMFNSHAHACVHMLRIHNIQTRIT